MAALIHGRATSTAMAALSYGGGGGQLHRGGPLRPEQQGKRWSALSSMGSCRSPYHDTIRLSLRLEYIAQIGVQLHDYLFGKQEIGGRAQGAWREDRQEHGLKIVIPVEKNLGDRTPADMKTLAPGVAYSESASTAFSHSVEKRQEQVSLAYHAAAMSLDAELGSQPGRA